MWRKEARQGDPRTGRRPGRFLALAAVLVAMNAAGIVWIRHDLLTRARQKIRVLSAFPTPGSAVDQADRFTLVFDEPLVSPEEVGGDVDRPAFALVPQPPGRWRWAAPDRLEFLLAKRLPPGCAYTLRPAGNLEALTGRRVVGPAEFHYQTRPLWVGSCFLESADPKGVHFSLCFNQPVLPADLMKDLSVRDANGADLRPACLSQEASERLVLRADAPPGRMLAILVAAGLKGEGAQLAMGQDYRTTLTLPERFMLLRAEVRVPRLAKSVLVQLRFSRDLSLGQALPAVRLAPPVEGLEVRWEGRTLALRGPLECGRRYTVTVPAAVLAQDGKTLEEEQSATFEVPQRDPAIEFAAGNGILSPWGNLCLDLEAVSVKRVQVSASRVHANNLLAHLRRPRDTDGTARALASKTLDLDLPANVPGKAALDLKGLLDQPTGVYRVDAWPVEHDRWSGDSAIVAVTDLGITAKRHRDGYLVWVTSIATAKPVGGVAVRAITYNNQTVAEGATDDDGCAILKADFHHPDGPAYVITAEKGGDLSFLQMGEGRARRDIEDYEPGPGPNLMATALSPDGEWTVGLPRPKTYDVMLYGERGVYRPGETIHLSGIIRDAAGAVPPGFPLVVRVTRPDGREVARLPVSPEFPQQGMFHLDYATPEDGQTGEYKFTATLPGASEALGSEEAMVEAFVPVRLEVKARATQDRYEIGEGVEAEVAARYLFDQPGAGLPVAVSGVYRPQAFASRKFRDYFFGEPTDTITSETKTEGSLDDAGKTVLEIEYPQGMRQGGLWRGQMAATVAEPGGRSVSAAFSYTVDLEDYHIGLRLPPTRVVPADKEVQIDWVRVAPGGEPVEAQTGLEYELSRVEWDWVLERVNDRPVWKDKERLVREGKGTIEETGAEGRLSLRCPQPGKYRLAVRQAPSAHSGQPGGGPETVAEFFASDSRQAPGTLVERPEKLEIVLDRAKYPPGSVAKVLVRSPFAGTMLLTVETDRVIDRQVLEMTGTTAEMELPVPFDLRGGAFVSATVLRAMDAQRDKWLPLRASGVARLATDHSNQRHVVSIDAPAKVRPGQRVRVTARVGAAVDPGRPPVMHLWAVDEGVLLCTDYRTPSPLGHFLAPRKLEVATLDLFDNLLPDYKRPADIRRIGGDGGEEDEGRRRSILPIRTTQSTVLWHRAATVGPDGTISAELDLPQFTGELRLMAVAVDGDCYGSAQRPLTVASPLVVEASWPRFASPGDRFQVPVKLFNNTGDRVVVRLSMKVQGPLSVSPAAESGMGVPPMRITAVSPVADGQGRPAPATHGHLAHATLGEVELLPGNPRTIWLDATAEAMGQASADVLAAYIRPGGESDDARSHAEFTIRPAVPLHSVVRLLTVRAGEPLRLDRFEEFLRGTARATVEVSGRPDVQLRSAVEALIQYPYGCVEQTTSRLWGILYAPDLLLADSPRDVRVQEVGRMIRAGILRLWSMQTRGGGMAYWPGGSEECLWPSAYVGQFLAEARHAGYALDREFTDNLADYLLRKLNEPSQELPDNLRAQICRVLAAFGKPQHGWMNRLSEKADSLDVGGRADLAAAFASAGRKDLALKVLSQDTLAMSIPTTTGGRLTSGMAQYASLLRTLLDIQSDHPWADLLAERLHKGRSAVGYWGTTLENAMCIAALARYQIGRREASDFTGLLKTAGGAAHAFDSNAPARVRLAEADLPAEVATTGKGPVYLHVKAEGLAKAPPKPYDCGLVVRRQWRDLALRVVDPAKVRVGDLIVAEVYFRTDGRDVDNVAIVDALPGGVEVENTRLATSIKAPVPSGGGSQAAVPAPPVLAAPTPATPGDSARPLAGAQSRASPATQPASAASRPAPPWDLPDSFRGCEESKPDRVEWLDDRVVIFASASNSPRVYRYLLRATSSGRFQLPQLQASCMYDPAVASLHGGGQVIVAK